MRQIQGKLVLLRVNGGFELPRVRVIGVQLWREQAFHSTGTFLGVWGGGGGAPMLDMTGMPV